MTFQLPKAATKLLNHYLIHFYKKFTFLATGNLL